MFEWEESTFLGLKSLYERWVTKPKQRERAEREARLADHRGALMLLARMLSGRNVGLFETDNPILCLGDRVCLPPSFHAAATPKANLRLYEMKVILAALAIRDRWQDDHRGLHGFVESLKSEFPRLSEKICYLEKHLVCEEDVWDLFGIPHADDILDPKSVEATTPGAPEAAEITTEIEGRGQIEVEVLPDSEDDGHGADMPIHTFEKTECLEETSGLSRKKDADDELKDHEEALREVEMRQVIRSAERPRSIYRSDVILDGLSLEVADSITTPGIPYPEWDYKKRRYKNGWCRLQVHHRKELHSEWLAEVEVKHAALIQHLRKQFANLISEFLQVHRQPLGAEFDLDAVVDSRVRMRTGHTPDEHVYCDRKKDLHDVAAVLLLDLSFSTDSWVGDIRVLDAIMETVYCVGEVIDGSIESFAVAGFSSNTRRSCRFELLKDFREPWQKAKLHFGALQPQGYTRIGPALRHAHEMLLNQQTSRRIVILITDGRPCDYDRYEGTYGIRDVRKAIETGKLHGLRTHAFAIEKQACETFPQMFSRDHFDVVPSPRDLSRYMSRLFARLLAS